MKKLLVLILATTWFAATAQTSSFEKVDINKQIQEYQRKSKNKKLGGLVSLGLGGGFFLAGSRETKKAGLDNPTAGMFELILGGGLIAGGLVEFISSVQNRHKARVLIDQKKTVGFYRHTQLHFGISVIL